LIRSSLLSILCLVAILGSVAASEARADQGIAVKVTLAQAPAKMVTAPPGQNASPGMTVFYLFRLLNTSLTKQSYRLSVVSSPSWKSYLPQNRAGRARPLAPGESVSILVAVSVPKKTAVGTTCSTTLTATTTRRPRLTDSDTVVTTVVSPSGLSLHMDVTRTARPGDVISYHVALRDETKGRQQVNVTAESVQGWPVRVMGVAVDGLTLASGKTAEFIIDVIVPKDAPASAVDALIVTAQAQGALTEQVQVASEITVQ